MKDFLNILFLILPILSFSQISDDFMDGDFSNNPTWNGTINHFVVNPTFQVQTDTTATTVSYLATPHLLTDLSNKEWKFYSKMTFAGSASNYVRIYLTADNQNLISAMNGYYIQLGEALATDAVRLFKLVNGVSTQICASPDGTIATSANIGVRILRSSLGNWQLFVDFTGGENYILQGSGTDASSLLGTHFGLLAKYTSGNSKKVFFDKVFVGDEIVDITPPDLISSTVISATEVDLVFSEDVEETSIQNTTNYTFTPALNLVSATRDVLNFSKVKLTFGTPISNGITHQFTINNVTDLSNNSNSVNGNFVFMVAEIPLPGDVIITEFMADPSPVIGLPELEFVEIYNKSTKYFNLTGWKLGDNATEGTITSGWLAPGEYKVLCAAASVAQFPGSIAVTSFPSLNNATDDVVLKNPAGNILDKITYFDTWYRDEIKKQGGYTLERINPNHPCSDFSNWIASNDPIGGTPGTQNSVNDLTPDTSPLQITETLVIEPNGLELSFNKGLDSLSIFNAIYTFTPNLTVDEIVVTESYPRKVNYTFQENILASQLYQFTINNLQDCWTNTTNVNGQFIIPDNPLPGDVIITEFMADPSPAIGLPELEFVEIHNKSNKYFNITGWKLGDNATFGTITNGTLAPGEYKILCSATSVPQFPGSIAVTSFPSLNNSTDDVIIKSAAGIILDKITYYDSWYRDDVKKQGGFSLELINPNHPCSDANNWIASNHLDGGTPGAQNSVYNLTPNSTELKIIETKATAPNFLEVRFNRGLDSLSVFSSIYTFNPALTVDAITVSEIYPRKILIQFQENLLESKLYQFTIENIQDCWMSNTTLNGKFTLPEAVATGDLIINEVLFNPITGGSDFVEIRNNSNKVLDLKGLYLANIKNGAIGNQKQIPVNFLLHPNELAVVTADSLSQIQTYPMSVPGRFIQMSLPSYNTDSSTVFLLKDSTSVLDRVSYSAKWHLKLIADVKAKSLEKIDPFGASNDKKNWHTAAEAVGFATPGAPNSQYSPAQHNGNFSLTSTTVSPDNDGFEDVLQINYVMEQEGMVASVKIFDDRGRLIKHLCKNELLGMEGSLMWDGITESNLKASIGTYVVLFEAFKTEGGDLFVQKKAFVVAGKL
ncbi:MAG: lamin tail domain-containing protein [Crocinitomicaceae bacterium]|nr:lamin tail domain-containing protein [Crocinitomicaceae bacterium]